MWSYISIFAVLLVCESVYFAVAAKYGILDRPNHRSSHTRVTIRGGGIVFYAAVLAYGVLSGFQFPWFIAGTTLIAGISFTDDIRSIPNRVRLVFQFTAMALLFYQLGLFAGLPWWYVAVALVVCTGIINAFNFMDGINGMTGGYSLAVIIPLFVINRELSFIDERLLIITGFSLVVFCMFNFRKRARCFAGDVGALTIAFIILFALGRLILQTGNVFYILLLALYGVDSIMTIVRRLSLGENIFEAHRKHAYQLLSNELGFPQVAVSAVYALLQLGISLAAVYTGMFGWQYFTAVILVLSAIYPAVIKAAAHR